MSNKLPRLYSVQCVWFGWYWGRGRSLMPCPALSHPLPCHPALQPHSLLDNKKRTTQDSSRSSTNKFAVCTELNCPACTALYWTTLYCTWLYCTALNWTDLYCMYCTTLYCTAAMYFTPLYCTAMYFAAYCTALNFAELQAGYVWHGSIQRSKVDSKLSAPCCCTVYSS